MVPSNDFEAELGFVEVLSVIIFSCILTVQKSTLPREAPLVCFTRPVCISFKSCTVIRHFSFGDGAPLQHNQSEILRTTQIKANSKKLRNAERINFVPVSYIVVARWQGKRRLLVALIGEGAADMFAKGQCLLVFKLRFLHFLLIIAYF